jgi:hypothetical protein
MRFIPVKEAIDMRLLGNGDYQKRDRLRLAKWAKHVFNDMNLTTLKIARREYFQVNKRTNSITLPCPFEQFSSLNVVYCGVEIPVYRNDNIKESDIYEIDAAKDCTCERNCGYKLCSLIKSYVAVSETKTDQLPNGTPISFTCVSRKGVNANGFFYEELQYPQRVYEDGVWTDTVLHTEQRKLCEVEVDQNGCCCDTEQNINNVCDACGWSNSFVQGNSPIPVGGNSWCPPNATDDTWIYWCSTKLDWFSVQCGNFPKGFRGGCNNVYNISELGDRLIFPANFGWDKVLVRWYDSASLNDLQIPIIALDTFIVGLMWWDCRFNDNKQQLAVKYESDYSKLKWGMLLELNKYRIAEQRMILNPPVNVPSYLPLQQYWGGDWYGGMTSIN